MRWTRREALAAAAAGIAAGTLGARAGAQPIGPVPPLKLRRGIDITPSGLRWPGTAHDYRVLRAQPWAAELIAGASVLRLWADWPVLQPEPVPLEDPANPGFGYLQAFDAQVDAAVADGLEVIVMPYRYPLWVTGATRWRWGVAEQYQLPEEGHGPYSHWAAFAAALWRRYAGRMTYFEVVNEPNLQLRPFDDIASRVAVMMATVDGLARRHDFAATCLAPSCSDAEEDVPFAVIGQHRFADALLDALDAAGFEGGDHWVWSLHNYGETESGGNRSRRLRAQLDGRWRGRAAPDGKPLLHATEGGVRISHVEGELGDGASPAAVRARQAEKLRAALGRFATTPGLGLHTQYTIHAEAHYDCGIRETDGRHRPAYDAWVA